MKKIYLSFLIILFLISGCTFFEKKSTDGDQVQLANPASVFCVEQGGTLQMEETDQGTVGYCLFADDTKCEEWAFYRGECEMNIGEITSFDDCVQAGYPILESYPEQCQTPSGDIFVNDSGVFSIDEAKQTSKTWILEKSPTYLFDGSDLVLLEEATMRCPGCYLFTFSFTSAHAGYGDRSQQMVAQVITEHKLKVTLEFGEIISVITDDVFDEMTGEFLN